MDSKLVAALLTKAIQASVTKDTNWDDNVQPSLRGKSYDSKLLVTQIELVIEFLKAGKDESSI